MQASDFKEWDKTAARISKDRGMRVLAGGAREKSMMALFFEMATIVLISVCASTS